jgi:hypothetical protein
LSENDHGNILPVTLAMASTTRLPADCAISVGCGTEICLNLNSQFPFLSAQTVLKHSHAAQVDDITMIQYNQFMWHPHRKKKNHVPKSDGEENTLLLPIKTYLTTYRHFGKPFSDHN